MHSKQLDEEEPQYISSGNDSYDYDEEDPEKKYYSDFTEDSASPSASRISSPPHTPILRQPLLTRNIPKTKLTYSHRSYRRFSRYFTLLLLATVICVILILTHQSWLSTKTVQLGLSKPPPPPPTWEKFPFLKRYHGGVRTLVSKVDNVPEYPGTRFNESNLPHLKSLTRNAKKGSKKPVSDTVDSNPLMSTVAFNPYVESDSEDDKEESILVNECFLDEEKTVRIPTLRVYSGVPSGMPENVIGSYDLLGIRDDICFDRFGRLGPYGFGYSKKSGGTGAGLNGHRDGVENTWKDIPQVDYRNVRWADAQKRCQAANAHRFESADESKEQRFLTMKTDATSKAIPEVADQDSKKIKRRRAGEEAAEAAKEKTSMLKKPLPRTVVLIRTWWDYEYDQEDILYLRALISELSIISGAEYSVKFLIHVKDDNMQIWADEAIYQQVLDNSLPEEFRGMGILWSERQMGLIYGGVAETFYRDLPVHGTYRSTFMPVQYFAHCHPEYDFIWHWEMDIRYTGSFYNLFDRASKWSKAQPRKGLWERNSRFYIPSEHGSWEDFKQMVRVQTEHGTSSKGNLWSKIAASDRSVPGSAKLVTKAEKPIWGPEPPVDDNLDTTNDPNPSTSYSDDKFEWGVGEDADLITFNPLFDPDGTNWLLADDFTGYNTTRGPPPRRAAINTASRLSRRLLNTMHQETALKRHTMFTEMWPASCALHHGFKAVYVPHPVFIDRRWPSDYLAAVFNGGRNGASGGTRTSVFSDERQHNFLGVTWYYHAGFPLNLWKRWLGYRVDNDGGEQEELHGEGRMCLPAVLLHPVKHVDLVL